MISTMICKKEPHEISLSLSLKHDQGLRFSDPHLQQSLSLSGVVIFCVKKRLGRRNRFKGLARWKKENVRSLIHPPNEALSTVKGEMAKWSFHLFLRGKMKKLLPQWFILPSFGESHGCRIHNWVFCQKIFEVLNKCVLGIDAIDPVGNAAKTWIELV